LQSDGKLVNTTLSGSPGRQLLGRGKELGRKAEARNKYNQRNAAAVAAAERQRKQVVAHLKWSKENQICGFKKCIKAAKRAASTLAVTIAAEQKHQVASGDKKSKVKLALCACNVQTIQDLGQSQITSKGETFRHKIALGDRAPGRRLLGRGKERTAKAQEGNAKNEARGKHERAGKERGNKSRERAKKKKEAMTKSNKRLAPLMQILKPVCPKCKAFYDKWKGKRSVRKSRKMRREIVRASSTTKVKHLVAARCSAQQWAYDDNSGLVTLSRSGQTKCLQRDASGSIVLGNCSDQANQKWSYVLRNKQLRAHGGKFDGFCLSRQGDVHAHPTGITLRKCRMQCTECDKCPLNQADRSRQSKEKLCLPAFLEEECSECSRQTIVFARSKSDVAVQGKIPAARKPQPKDGCRLRRGYSAGNPANIINQAKTWAGAPPLLRRPLIKEVFCNWHRCKKDSEGCKACTVSKVSACNGQQGSAGCTVSEEEKNTILHF